MFIHNTVTTTRKSFLALQVPIYVYAGNIQKYTLKYVVMWEMW